MSDLAGLIDRLEKLDGPSDLLDAEVYATIGGAPHSTTAGDRVVPLIEKGDPTDYPSYTASLDAAIALVEKVLPEWEWAAGDDAQLGAYGAVYRSISIGGEGYSEDDMVSAVSPAIALLLALLSALQSGDSHDR